MIPKDYRTDKLSVVATKQVIPQLVGYRNHLGISNQEMANSNEVLRSDANIRVLDRGIISGKIDQLIAYCKALGIDTLTIKNIGQYQGPYDKDGNVVELSTIRRKIKKGTNLETPKEGQEVDASLFNEENLPKPPEADSDGSVSAEMF